MKRILCGFAFAAALMPLSLSADWRPVEKVDTYAITGTTGIALYTSIGERGPKASIGRAIAFTDFELLWSRDYRPQADGSCVLATARPHLTITYRLPKPADPLPPATRRLWDVFIEGVTAHEKVHRDFIVDLVEKIENVSVGLSAPDDPNCRKVRAELQKHLGRLSTEQQQKSRAFDREEMSKGGNVHRLILRLVNG